METPILTKKQVKSTLSAKKNKPKETVKNVLSVPYKAYWPEISADDNQILQKVLSDNLPKLKEEVKNCPWDVIKHIPKLERRAFQKNFLKESREMSSAKDIGVRLGINEVSKLLENNLAGAVLIPAEVEPRILVQHIIDQAVLYKVPILIVDQLKPLLKKQCGISSAAFAIEKNISPDSELNLITKSVESILAKYPRPENHINYPRSLDSFTTTSKPKDETVKREVISKVDENEIRKSVYLKRPNTGRAFVPKEIEEPLKKVFRMEVDETGFIPFTEEPIIEESQLSNNYKYKSLVVKRLKGDKNRNKRLIESLKQKKK